MQNDSVEQILPFLYTSLSLRAKRGNRELCMTARKVRDCFTRSLFAMTIFYCLSYESYCPRIG